MLPEIRAVNIGSLERGFFYCEFNPVLELTTQTHTSSSRVDTMSIKKEKKLTHNQ